jgi:hypothetical protein
MHKMNDMFILENNLVGLFYIKLHKDLSFFLQIEIK